MQQEFVLGIDIGTSGTKVMLVGKTGEVMGTAYRGYDILKPEISMAEQNPEELWTAAAECIKELTGKYPVEGRLIKGMSFSGQMHGLVAVDKDGIPVRNAIIWADQRSEEVIQDVYAIVGKEEFCSRTGNALSTGFLAVSLLWMKKKEPENYEKTAKVMLPKDYIRYRLCGEIATDRSDASSTGILNRITGDWDFELMEKLGMDSAMFPQVYESREIAGIVKKSCQEELGLPSKVQVIYGGGDSLMQGTGNGILLPGVLSCNIGTASQIAAVAAEPLYDKEFRINTFCHVKKGLWNLQGSSLTGGVSLKWLKDNILHMKSFEEMTSEAEKVQPGSEGLLFLPYLNGERCPYNDSSARGIYLGMSLRHTRAHIIRSTMEGMLFGLRQSLEILKEMGISCEKIIASGGGARGALFRQMQADIFQAEVYTSKVKEQACLGAAICAFVGIGVYTSFEEACRHMVSMEEKTAVPDKENSRIYEESYKRYLEIYPHNRELFILDKFLSHC